MSDPTGAQIHADSTVPVYDAALYLGGSWGTDITSAITNIDHQVETSGEPSGVAFGTIVAPRGTVSFNDLGFAFSWENTPIRVRYGFATSNLLRRFVGVITDCEWETAGGAWEARGWDALIEAPEVPIRSPVFKRRPIATATTLSSIENPATDGYAAGIINYILWECGGRPYEQAASYPDALWYYACTHAVIAPEYTYIAGENPWQALQRFVRACGGQLYQDDEGTMRYVDPLTMASGTPAFTFTDAALTAAQREAQSATGYQSPRRRATVQKSMTGATCAYVSRIVQGVQVVYQDTIARRVEPGATITVHCDTTLPLFSVDRAERDAAVIRTARAPSTGEVSIGITSSSAQRVTVQIENTLDEPVQIDGVRVWGRPISAGEEGTAEYTPGGGALNQGRTLPIDDNPWIQSERHARQICRMAYEFASTAGDIITIADVAYDPYRFVGEIVAFTCGAWNIEDVPHRIVALRPNNGAFMEVDLAPVGELPTREDVWIVGTTYSGTDERELSY